MKCSAWKTWHLVNDEMIPDLTCQNEAKVLLSNKPYWENQPYCEYCASWMMSAHYMYNLNLEIKPI